MSEAPLLTNSMLGVSVAVTLQTLTLSSLVRSQYPLPFLFFLQGAVMKHKIIVKQRNRFVVLALHRKAGVHRKSNKALRRQINASIAQLVEQ